MSNDREEFTTLVKEGSLKRQRNKCASCGTALQVARVGGRISASAPDYGEGVNFHHIIPTLKLQGPPTLENCAALCRSCHYSAHAANTKDISMYSDLAQLPTMAQKIKRIAKLYPHYNG